MKVVLLFALLTLEASLVNAQEARNVTQAIHYIKLAYTLREVNKSEESISLLKRALPAVEAKNAYWEAVTNELLGLSFKDLRDYQEATHYLELAREQYARLKYVASAWGVNEVIRDISGKNLYAGIQIGLNDVKLAIFKTQYESDFYEKRIQTVMTIPDVTIVADASGSLQKGQIALQTCLDSIRQYSIPTQRTFIVFSSDVRSALATGSISKAQLFSQLAAALPSGSNLQVDTTLTEAREAELFTIGAIPRKVWSSTSALNIGGNSITGGYFDGSKQFHYLAAPIGVNTLMGMVDRNKVLPLDAYKKEAQRVVNTMVDTALVPRIQAFKERRTIGIGGDIAWALVTYLHPERSLSTAVPITLADVEKFKRLALTDYATLVRPDLSSITDLATRHKAEQLVRDVQNQITTKELITGALLMEATFKAYNEKSSSKRFVFIRDSEIGWVTGKFLETINFEYESTIAKGAMYTR